MDHGIPSTGGWHGRTLQVFTPTNVASICPGRGWLGMLSPTCPVCLSHCGTFLNGNLPLWTHVWVFTYHRDLSFIRTLPMTLAHIPWPSTSQTGSTSRQALLKKHTIRRSPMITKMRPFQVGDSVWLSISTAGKWDPRWEGKWVVHSIPGSTCYVSLTAC